MNWIVCISLFALSCMKSISRLFYSMVRSCRSFNFIIRHFVYSSVSAPSTSVNYNPLSFQRSPYRTIFHNSFFRVLLCATCDNWFTRVIQRLVDNARFLFFISWELGFSSSHSRRYYSSIPQTFLSSSRSHHFNPGFYPSGLLSFCCLMLLQFIVALLWLG